MCTSFLGSIDVPSKDISQRIAIAAIGRSPVERQLAFARERGWKHLKFYATVGDDFARDYRGLAPDGTEWPALDVWVKRDGKVFHFLGGELGGTSGARGLSMHMVVIPPGAKADPHSHRGYETGICVLEGRVETRYGARLESRVVSEAGDFLFIPPGVLHEAINLSATEPARAIVSRNDPAEQDNVVPYEGDEGR